MRKVTPLMIQVLLMLYTGTPVPAYPAQLEILRDFYCDGLMYLGGGLTPLGNEWAERVLGILPPRGYGGEGKFYKVGSLDNAYTSIEVARRDAIELIGVPGTYQNGAYILKAVELIERQTPQFKTTYLL